MPRFRPILKNSKFYRQRGRIQPVDVSIYTCSVADEGGLKIRREHRIRPFDDLRKSEPAPALILFERLLAKDLCGLTPNNAPHHVHLPKPVRCRNVALCEIKIAVTRGLDVWDAAAVLTDRDAFLQAFDRKLLSGVL